MSARPADILSSIVETTRNGIRAGLYRAAAEGKKRPEGARFESSLREPGTRIIAEIKHRSPSSGEILPHADRKVETLALAYRRGHAAAISVVTEREFFGGHPDWVARAKGISGLPVLMKDFFLEESQLDFASSLGADAILLMAAILDDATFAGMFAAAGERGLAVVAEVHDEEELRRVSSAGAAIVGVNARDLRTFEVSLAGASALARIIPPGALRLAESGVRSRADIESLAIAGFEAFLVGETLLKSDNPEEALRELRGDR